MQSETKNFTPCFILVSYSMTESRGREENERLKENRVHLAMVTFAAINSLQSLSNSPPTDAMLVSPLYIFASLAMAAAVGVSAQDASPCVLDCANKAVAPSGCDGLDNACVCDNMAFKSTATACLQDNCSSDDQQTAIQLHQERCGM
jgi:hypothetical protein